MAEPRAGPGRPRSEESRRAILEAALRLARRDGYASLTMDGIAAEAGVGKQTIYRWWPSKAAVLLEALHETAEADAPPPEPTSLRADVRSFLGATFQIAERAPGLVPVLRALMAEAQLDDAFRRQLWSVLFEPRRTAFRGLLERARARQELDPRADLELLIDVAFGVMWYRLLTARAPVDASLAAELAEHLARAGAPRGAARAGRGATSRRP